MRMADNKLKKAALTYRRLFGWPVIPIIFEPEDNGKLRKKPLVQWKTYQEKKPTVEETGKLFDDDRAQGISLICGKVSGVVSLDLDEYKPDYDPEKVREALGELPPAPTFTTPRGGRQLLFKCPAEGIQSVTDLLPGMDVKAGGGLATLPPSSNGVGKYAWAEGMGPRDLEPPELPPAALAYIIRYIYISREVSSDPRRLPTTSLTSSDFHFFTEGRRDEDLFRAANCLVKGGAEPSFIQNTLELLTLGCTPPFDLKEIPAKIESALKRAERRERNISAEVREWVLTSSGFYLTSDCFNGLQVTSREEKKAVILEMLRLHKAGVIERHGNKNGCYRLVNTNVEYLDFLSAPTDEFPIDLPLGLSDYAVINSKGILTFAGSKDAGKTALALELIKRNAGRFPILYVTSEMGQTELRKRLEAHKDMTLEKWNAAMKAAYRIENVQDLITPERKLFIIDYIEPPEEQLYKVGTIFRSIHEKLKDGVAVCFIQKQYQALLGRGGQFSLDKARLYVGLDTGKPNKATIVSCKSFRGVNPRSMTLQYKIFGGWKIEPMGFWKYEETRP